MDVFVCTLSDANQTTLHVVNSMYSNACMRGIQKKETTSLCLTASCFDFKEP